MMLKSCKACLCSPPFSQAFIVGSKGIVLGSKLLCSIMLKSSKVLSHSLPHSQATIAALKLIELRSNLFGAIESRIKEAKAEEGKKAR